MKEKIRSKLSEIENETDTTIISARDFGSTAWSLDSENSDRDVAFIFLQDKEDYIKLGKYRQNIDRNIEIDGQKHTFMGWNIKRFMELLDSSNPTAIEYLNSPITYYELSREQLEDELNFENTENEEFILDTLNWFPVEELREHANNNFKPIALFYHYRSMAKSNFEKYIENGNDLTAKRHLYILRGLSYARYVEKTHDMPPLHFPDFHSHELTILRGEEIPEWIYREIGELIKLKTQGNGGEKYTNEEMWNWIRQELDNRLDKEKHDTRGIKTKFINEKLGEII